MRNDWLQRGELILGAERSGRLLAAHVLIVGLGGVGSWAAEMLCRAGVGTFTIVDADVVDVTNVNRQMPALSTTVGLPKCEVVAERLRCINPEVQIFALKDFIAAEDVPQLLDRAQFSFVVDAIDTLKPKAALIVACWERGVKIVSSMGAGAKSDLSLIRVGDIWKSEHCTLAKNLRRELRNWRGVLKLPVVFSMEPPCVGAICPNPQGGKPVIGSLGYYTATFGCYLAEYVIRNI